MPSTRSGRHPKSLSVALAVLAAWNLVSLVRADEVLFDFDGEFQVAGVEARDARVDLREVGGNNSLRLSTGHKAPWPGITLKPNRDAWDLSAFAYVAVDVTNVGQEKVAVSLRIDSPGPDGKDIFDQAGMDIGPGQSETLKLPIKRSLPTVLAPKLFGMRGNPGGLRGEGGIDAGRINQLLVFVPRPTKDHVFQIDDIRAGGSFDSPKWLDLEPDEFFPMIDKYGQFVHGQWPNKTVTDADLNRQIEEEAANLETHTGPADWNQYGGWIAGPQLQATGHFRAEKREGKWWLVDPNGRLFWSHGSDCVRSSTAYTPITDREFYFAELPARESPMGSFYGKGSWAPHGYYKDKNSYATYNFTGSNLMRKYGPNWEERYSDLCHRRLRSWGMNSIGNWSSTSIYLMRRTPYVATVNSGHKPLQGSTGYWGKFPDVFDPDFQAVLQRRMTGEKDRTADDPWCIGYFVDNELAWGDELSLAEATLASPSEQVAKRVFIDDLKGKYETIEKLNSTWATEHASWGALRECRQPPGKDRARDDLAEFYTKTAEQYFRCCRDAVKEAAPHTLYLGCRFAWVNDRVVRAAAKFCDVVSFNRYSYSVADLDLPSGVDKPVIIGEFHFGALDRGMFHTGLKPVANQAERAQTYADYVRGALENRTIVGTHWFQCGDQATTGRGDGENYQIGLLDVCDTPYPETIEKVREVGYQLYRIRLGE